MLLNVPQCTRCPPPREHDWAPNANSANVEKPFVTHKATEVIKVTIFLKDLGISVYLLCQILMLSPLVRIHLPGATSFPLEQNHILDNLMQPD